MSTIPKWLSWVLIAFIYLAYLSCSPKLYETSNMLRADELIYVDEESDLRYNQRLGTHQFCNDPDGYIPDPSYLDHFRVRKVKVCFHFMNSSDSTKNFSEKEASNFAWQLLESVNNFMLSNRKLNLPEGNDIPVLPTLIQYEWTHSPDYPVVQHHYDDELFYIVTRGKNRNNADRRVMDKYALRNDMVNIFVMPHHPDSVASSTYSPFESGIALANNLKITGIFENKKRPWEIRGLLAHELGHVLGLSHAWTGYDGCEDTAKHPNLCFSQTGIPPCEGPISNNLMDYNALQNALSPCQIGKMHSNLSRLNSMQRRLLVKDWCHLDTTANIIIRDKIRWTGSKDLNGHIIIQEGAELTVDCRISMAPGAKIIVRPGGRLYLRNAHVFNDCGVNWGGIEVKRLGDRKRGEVMAFGDVRLDNLPETDTILN